MAPLRVPLVYVRAGRLVRATDAGAWVESASLDASVARARELFAVHDRLYVVDLDGQESGVANLPFFQALERRRVFPWVDAGCRKPEDAMDLLFAGAEAITVHPRHLTVDQLAEVGDLSEADVYLGLAIDGRGLERGLRARDAAETAGRVAATGVVLYEAEGADLHAAENAALDLQRAGLPVAWVARPGSPHRGRAAASDRFTTFISAESDA